MIEDSSLQQAIAALKAGQPKRARVLLAQLLRHDPHNEAAWLWMSGAVDTDSDRLLCLRQVLAINPHNERARQGVELLTRKGVTMPAAAEPARTLHAAPSPEPPPVQETRLHEQEIEGLPQAWPPVEEAAAPEEAGVLAEASDLAPPTMPEWEVEAPAPESASAEAEAAEAEAEVVEEVEPPAEGEGLETPQAVSEAPAGPFMAEEVAGVAPIEAVPAPSVATPEDVAEPQALEVADTAGDLPVTLAEPVVAEEAASISAMSAMPSVAADISEGAEDSEPSDLSEAAEGWPTIPEAEGAQFIAPSLSEEPGEVTLEAEAMAVEEAAPEDVALTAPPAAPESPEMGEEVGEQVIEPLLESEGEAAPEAQLAEEEAAAPIEPAPFVPPPIPEGFVLPEESGAEAEPGPAMSLRGLLVLILILVIIIAAITVLISQRGL